MPPTVSVNICTYNSSRYVAATLRSVLAQTVQDFEIVIVDDGSTDGTPDLIEREFPDSRITIVRERHVTLRVARPLALAHSRGEFIAFLDSDDLWAPVKLEQQLAIARARPDAGLIFSDCELVDSAGQPLNGRFSDQFAYRDIDCRSGYVHLELLRRGNFIPSPSPIVPAAMLRAVGGFNQSYRHVNDFELWLRLARRYPFAFIDRPLALYRVHDSQFTRRRMEITLPEQCALIHPMMRSASYPREVRIALGDNLLGQHRLAWSSFIRQRRYRWAALAALGMCRYPDRLVDYARDFLKGTVVGAGIEASITTLDAIARARAVAVDTGRRVFALVRRAGRLAARLARRQPGAPRPAHQHDGPQVWIDGTCLGRDQAGYFNLLTEMTRVLTTRRAVLHMIANRDGRRALRSRLGEAAAGIQFHSAGWRTMHWSHLHEIAMSWQAQLLMALAALIMSIGIGGGAGAIAVAALLTVQAGLLLDELRSAFRRAMGKRRETWAARLVRYAWRRWPRPRWHSPEADTIEVLFWRGRFRWRNSRRIAIVQDMTPRTHPEVHTGGNVAEFGEFLRYVQQHATEVMTVSEQSRRDIVAGMAVSPLSVSVITMPVHPQYIEPRFGRGYVDLYGVRGPYVLCVGTIEPRKNLRRLIKAFDLVGGEDVFAGHELVIVGAQGWDAGFGEFLRSLDISPRVRVVGYAALEHLPSLYHYATVVACASVYEGFGLPVLEAMCSSGVVIASRAGALPEVLGDGIQFDPFDTAAIARALLTAASMSSEEQAAYRAQNRRRAEAHLHRIGGDGPLPHPHPQPPLHTRQ